MVTGSSFVFTSQANAQILIDLGMFQGPEEISKYNREPLKLDVSRLSGVIITHAHLDHCGRLPLLAKHNFSGPTYMTPATRELVELVLTDSAKIASYDESQEPLYTQNDVDAVLQHVTIVAYGKEFEISGVQAVFRDAGHILGSASVELLDAGKHIVFSGDLGNSPEPLMKPTETIARADVVVMESTYGDRLHPKEDSKQLLQHEINEIETNSGTLLIPTFSLERTQVLLHMLDHLKKENRIRSDTAVFLDGPMGIAATEIYRTFQKLYNQELAHHVLRDDPFDFPGLIITDTPKQSKKIKRHNGPKVIIAGSGMMTGGRIMAHAIDYLPQQTTRLLIVGYQGEGTLGRKIQEGAQSVEIFGKKVSVQATISEIGGLSAHADQSQLMSWLKAIDGVQTVFLIHGEDGSRHVLGEKITTETNIGHIVLPRLHEEQEIGV